jgi:hypothetical protein
LSDRSAIFISHAAPEDNKFTIWLGAKLAAMGYEVWADVLRLRGGDDWQRKLEDALRQRACKVLLVANPLAVDKQGVRNELQIASDVARTLKDNAFVIPLRLEPFQAPFLIAQAQYIDFQRGWAQGLRDLIAVLDEYQVPRSKTSDTEMWRELQTRDARTLVDLPELLTSNRLSVQHLPSSIFYCSESEQHGNSGGYAQIPYGSGTLSFAPANQNPSNPRPTNSTMRPVDKFLSSGWQALGIQAQEARKLVTQLMNVSLGNYFKLRGLGVYMMANRHETFWMTQTLPTGRIAFSWPPYSGSRQLQGRSLKRGVYWHFAVAPSFQMFPNRHVRVISRLIFTSDGADPIISSARMHQLRRSFAKGWRNARWRDMLLTFLYWLAEGSSLLTIPVNPTEGLVLRLPPVLFRSPVSLPVAESTDDDEDDPTPEPDEEYLEDDSEE